MKPHERRAAGAYPYFKYARWDERLACWREGSGAFDSMEAAKADAVKLGPGRYRLSIIDDNGLRDGEIFNAGVQSLR